MNLKQACKVLGIDDLAGGVGAVDALDALDALDADAREGEKGVDGADAHNGSNVLDERAVRRAYAKLAKTYRPDTHPEEFANIRSAYDVVMASLSTAKDPASNVVDLFNEVGAAKVQEVTAADQPHERAVSYVMMAEELGSVEEDVPKDNPLQSLENEFVQAIKDLQPAHVESEAKVVQLMEDYLAASSRQSRALRDYVERFLIGTCLGDYYLPHAVRERAADFSGLGNAVVVEHRLKPWEREFLLRFDESEVVTELFAKANTSGSTAERSLVHGAGYQKVFMHRLDSNEVRKVNRWMHWLDDTFGEDAGFVHNEFRQRWNKLKQIEPLSAFTVCLFAVLMAFSGIVLNAFGAPMGEFFKLPRSTMALTVLGLAALSWANFMLVILMRPVYREVQHRAVVFTLANFSIPLLVVEFVAMLLLIWGAAFGSDDAGAWGSPVVVVSGLVFVVLAFASRAGGWLERLPFTQLALRVGIYYLLLTIVVELLDNHIANTLWLLLGLIVISLRSRPMMHWMEKDNSAIPKGVFAFRRQQATYSITGLRIAMAVVGLASLVMMTVQKFILEAAMTPALSAIITATLLCFVALELALNGGIHAHHGAKTPSHQRLMRVGLFVVISLVVIRLQGLLDAVPSLQACIACYLVLAAWKHFSASS